MRRADRLFQIVQHLRARRLTTAAQLAEWLSVSERTIYRDVRDLSVSGVPVRGEAGVGYELDRSYDLRPIMFTPDEIDAAVFGLRMVEAFCGPDLTPHVHSALAKIALALPTERRSEIDSTRLFAPPFAADRKAWECLGPLREAVTKRIKVDMEYSDESNESSRRIIRPLGLYFWGKVWTLAAWCELRNDFRHFRLDRITLLAPTGQLFAEEPEKVAGTVFGSDHEAPSIAFARRQRGCSNKTFLSGEQNQSTTQSARLKAQSATTDLLAIVSWQEGMPQC